VNGEFAQLVALAAHGSAWLGGLVPGPAPALDTTNSTFQYVRSVRFERRSWLGLRANVATDVATWLEDARRREIDRVWLVIAGADGRTPPGRWLLVGTSKRRGPEAWHGSWMVREPFAPGDRKWIVEYRSERFQGNAIAGSDIAGARARLAIALKRAGAFALRHGLNDWADWFSDALELAETDDPAPPYHPDMLPAIGFSKPARRLLAMATGAWVFGGMGSWNDSIGFAPGEDQRSYDEVSATLYAAMLEAFAAAVNSDLEA
jgi:hypothetical protein